MTTHAEAREAICNRWSTEWGTRTPFVFEDEQSNLDQGKVPWTRVSIRELSSEQHTMGDPGTRKYWRQAEVLIQSFTLVTKGMKAASEQADAARAVFEDKSFGGIDCFEGQIRSSLPDGKWHMTVVQVRFDYYEVR
jgi:hypothetical protein